MFDARDSDQCSESSGAGKAVQATTRALHQRIQAELARRRRLGLGKANRAVLIAADSDCGIPGELIVDTALAPVDKIVWQILHRHGRRHGVSALLPCYRQLARQANVTSNHTIVGALAALRCRRWLTVCERSADDRGRRHGEVYILHGGPLPLQDTVFLDADYLDYLARATRHYRARVRGVARQTLNEIADPGH